MPLSSCLSGENIQLQDLAPTHSFCAIIGAPIETLSKRWLRHDRRKTQGSGADRVAHL